MPGRTDLDERVEGRRRLRRARGQHAFDLELAERREAGRRADGIGDLGEDVVRVRVAGVDERRVARRVVRLQAVDADQLGADADVGVAAAQQLGMEVGPLRVDVVAGGDVEPLEHDGAVEVGGLRRPPHDDARPVRRRRQRCVRPERGECGGADVVAGRHAFDEELVLDVVERRQQAGRRGAEGVALHAGHRGPRDGRVGDRTHVGACVGRSGDDRGAQRRAGGDAVPPPYPRRLPMPRPTRSRDAAGRPTRQRVVDAAADVFAERGYEGTTVAHVAEKAGLTTGSIYLHFAGKAELLAEAIVSISRQQDVHTAAMRGEPDVKPGLRRDFLDDAWRWIDPAVAEERAVALEAHTAGRRDEELRRHLAAIDEERLDAVTEVITTLQDQGVIDRAVDARALATWFMLVPLGAAQLEAVGITMPSRRAWQGVVERVLLAMLAPPTTNGN